MKDTYTIWKRCESCKDLSNGKKVSCRNCGALFLHPVTTNDEAPGGRTMVE